MGAYTIAEVHIPTINYRLIIMTSSAAFYNLVNGRLIVCDKINRAVSWRVKFTDNNKESKATNICEQV